MEALDGEVVREVWGGRLVEWSYLPAMGTSGGVLLCWDTRVVVKEDVELGAFSVSCLFRCVEDNFSMGVFWGVWAGS
ncbi:hypothetical protein ACSBR1_025863 [Camellia fascicularis]